MTHPKAPPPKVVSIGPARKVTCGWSMADTRKRTPIGFVETLANGTIVFIDKSGNETEMTAKEAREVDRALSHCAWVSEQRIEHLSGFTTVRVHREGDDVRVTHRGETHQMRIKHCRPHARFPAIGGEYCSGCKRNQLVVWVAINPPDRKPYQDNPERNWTKVCEACVDRLSRAPQTGLREVSTQKEQA